MSINNLTNKLNSTHLSHYNIKDNKIHLLPKNKRNKDVTVIIPVLNRDFIIKKTLLEMQRAIQHSKLEVNLLVVEYSNAPKHNLLCSELDLEYFYFKSENDENFNKSLAMNIGSFLSYDSKYLLFHDVDCIVPHDFFDLLFVNVKNTYANVIQTFGGGRLLYCSEDLTKKIVESDLHINDFRDDRLNIEIPEASTIGIFAPGGSVMVEYNTFINVGGFDYELFSGYSPEDAFFKAKLELSGNKFHRANRPFIDQYHLHHEAARSDCKTMVNYMDSFNTMMMSNKLRYLELKKNKLINEKEYFLNDIL